MKQICNLCRCPIIACPALAEEGAGLRLATSVGGMLTGRSAHLIIINDPLKPEEALSETSGGSATSGSTIPSTAD